MKQDPKRKAGALPGGDREPLAALMGKVPEGGRSDGRGGEDHSRGATVAVAVMLISFLLAFLMLLAVLCLPREEETLPTAGTVGTDAPAIPSGGEAEDGETEMSTAELYERCAPSVVSVVCERADTKSVGSGFVLTSNGYLATAEHVVEDAVRLTVVLANGREYSASYVAGNASADLAVLKIETEGLTPLSFGSSGTLRPGDRVVAIGTPLALDYAGSVDTGEVSYPNRTVRLYDETSGAVSKKMTLIQTNVAVNPGNSGCPLLNGAGEVVGVITMKLGNSTGMAFAIPSDGAAPILEAMRSGQEPDRALIAAVCVSAPKLGIIGETAKEGDVYGIRVLRFASGDYDVMRKLKVGDLILSVGPHAVTGTEALTEAVAKYVPGDTVELTVLRAGQRLTFSVILGE